MVLAKQQMFLAGFFFCAVGWTFQSVYKGAKFNVHMKSLPFI